MPNDQDNYRPPPSWAEVLGDEDLSVYQPQDQPAPPSPRSSPQRIANEVRRGRIEFYRQRRQERIETAGQIEDDARAFERVMDARAAHETTSTDDQIAADRHIRRNGLIPRKSTAEQLMAERERLRQRRAS